MNTSSFCDKDERRMSAAVNTERSVFLREHPGNLRRTLQSSARRVVDRTARLALVFVFALASVAGLAPAASAASTTFGTNSLIIPMDTTSQNSGCGRRTASSTSCCRTAIPSTGRSAIRRPGLVHGHRFLSGAATIQKLGTATTVSPYTYTGGPFIIDSADAAAAQPIITAWWAANANQPNVHKVTAGSVTANVDLILRSAPRIAIESINAGIAIAYFNAAGIPDGRRRRVVGAVAQRPERGPDRLQQQVGHVVPERRRRQRAVPGRRLQRAEVRRLRHAAQQRLHLFADQSDERRNPGVRRARQFRRPGRRLDRAVPLDPEQREQHRDVLRAARQRTDREREGPVQVAGSRRLPDAPAASRRSPTPSGTWTVDRARTAGRSGRRRRRSSNGLPGGSVQNWPSPLNAPPRRGRAHVLEPDRAGRAFRRASGVKYDWALNGVYHNGTGQGKLTFLGGHSYSTALPYSANSEAPYLRFFFNSLFFNGAAVANMTLQPSVTSVPQGTTTPVQLAFKNTGRASPSASASTAGSRSRWLRGVSYVSMASGPAPTVASVRAGRRS